MDREVLDALARRYVWWQAPKRRSRVLLEAGHDVTRTVIAQSAARLDV